MTLAFGHRKFRLALRLRQTIALPLYAASLLLILIAVAVAAIWPARSERQRQLREKLRRGLAGGDG
jgi:hypothetical protein